MSMESKLYNGDCLDIMPTLRDKSIDMILCDLPYAVTQNRADILIPFDKLWEQYERVIKDNGCIALFAQGIFYIDLVNSNRNLFRYDLVWDKQLTTGFLNAARMPLRQHEQIAVFYKSLPTYNPQMSSGYPLHGRGQKYLMSGTDIVNNNYGKFEPTSDDRKGNTDKYPTSILSFPKPHPSIAQHRTEKSIPLLEYLIKTYTNENETVLDNCMGSGTTGVACVRTKRSFIGIEKDEHYFRVASERIREQQNILTLF